MSIIRPNPAPENQLPAPDQLEALEDNPMLALPGPAGWVAEEEGYDEDGAVDAETGGDDEATH